MDDPDRDFWHAVRSFLLRYVEYNRERGASAQQLEQFQQTNARLLASGQLREVVVNRLAGLQLKCDYHNLIMLTLMQDLAKWSQEHYVALRTHPAPLDCILSQSINILSAQQQFHTIVPKQNQLIATLLSHPHTLQNMDHFKTLYRRLRDVKEFYPSATRDHQKQCFLRAVEECVERSAQSQNLSVVEFVFNKIFNELQNLEESHEYISHRLRIIRKIIKVLWIYHEDILHKMAFLLMRLSYQILTNRHLFSYVLPIYQTLISRLMQRPSIVPLLLYRHLIYNNIQRLLGNGGNCILLEALLGQLAHLFTPPLLNYFMRHYDWNFLELPICQQSLNLLHQYTQNRTNQGRPQFDHTKSYISRIHFLIKNELQNRRGAQEEEGKWKFYQLKRREFQQILQELNDKPKKVFKRIESITNADLRESALMRYVRLIKKTAHLNNRSMIDILATDHPVSAELFAQYVGVVLKQCRQNDLEQFMRLFTSKFFLTGESQQIARVIDTITQLFYRHQHLQQKQENEKGHLLKSSDATYTFANAILILNTDLHNPKNEQKISEESFLKMCKKINDNQDLPVEILKRTYANIKRNKINTFRDRGNMLGISLSNWLNICSDYETLPLSYYDPELAILDDTSLQCFIHDALASIIDEKETAKLQALVQRFIYDDRVFECQIIETLRRVTEKKPHLPLHILHKVIELGKFRQQGKLNEKNLSYYWLSVQLVTNFPHQLPTALICQLLISTWYVRAQLQDNLHLRQLAELRRVKQCARWVAKRESKKSIMDMFSNFLSFKDSDDDPEPIPTQLSRKGTYKALSNVLFDILKYNQSHRSTGLEYLLNYIHGEEARQYQEFVSCLFLIFNLLYFTEHCQRVGEDLFYELLGAKESSITKRLANLGKKDSKLYNLLINYCKFWILKLLLKEYSPNKLEQKLNNNYEYMLGKALEYLQRVDKQILNDLLKQLNNKTTLHSTIYQSFEKSIKKVYSNGSLHEVQFFFDRFNHQQQQSSEIKQENKQSSPTINKQEKRDNSSLQSHKKQSPKKQLPKKLQPKQEENEQKQEKQEKPLQSQNAQKQQEIDIEQKGESIKKQRSVDQLEQYINPDEEINKVEQEIEQHIKALKAAELNQPKQDVQAQNQQKTQAPKQEVHNQEVEISEDKQEQAPSIPVVMF